MPTAERPWSMTPERRPRPRVRQKKPSPLQAAAIWTRTNPSRTSTGKKPTAKPLARAVVPATTVHGTAEVAGAGTGAADAGAARAAIAVPAAVVAVTAATVRRRIDS